MASGITADRIDVGPAALQRGLLMFQSHGKAFASRILSVEAAVTTLNTQGFGELQAHLRGPSTSAGRVNTSTHAFVVSMPPNASSSSAAPPPLAPNMVPNPPAKHQRRSQASTATAYNPDKLRAVTPQLEALAKERDGALPESKVRIRKEIRALREKCRIRVRVVTIAQSEAHRQGKRERRREKSASE